MNNSKLIVRRDSNGVLVIYDSNWLKHDNKFKHLELLGFITDEQRQNVQKPTSTPEWTKFDFDKDMNIIEVERFTPEEKAKIIEEQEYNSKVAFFNSERKLALQIEEDSRLELFEVTAEQLTEIKTYIKSIYPNKQGRTLRVTEELTRPEIMTIYEENYKL